eukprot:2782671-Pyramimonas_sp.AAC.1
MAHGVREPVPHAQPLRPAGAPWAQLLPALQRPPGAGQLQRAPASVGPVEVDPARQRLRPSGRLQALEEA